MPVSPIRKSPKNSNPENSHLGQPGRIPILPNWKSPEWPTCQGPNFANLEGRDFTNSEGFQFGCIPKTPNRMDFKSPSCKGSDFVNPEGHDPEESQKRHNGTVRKHQTGRIAISLIQKEPDLEVSQKLQSEGSRLGQPGGVSILPTLNVSRFCQAVRVPILPIWKCPNRKGSHKRQVLGSWIYQFTKWLFHQSGRVSFLPIRKGLNPERFQKRKSGRVLFLPTRKDPDFINQEGSQIRYSGKFPIRRKSIKNANPGEPNFTEQEVFRIRRNLKNANLEL